jgi:hypothetical protein
MRSFVALLAATFLLTISGCRHTCSCGGDGIATGMNGLEGPMNVATAHNWQPAFYTPASPAPSFPTAVDEVGVERLNQPRRMPAGTPGL